MAFLRPVIQLHRQSSTKLPLKFLVCHPKSTAANVQPVVNANPGETANVQQQPRRDPLDTSFADSEASFKSKTTWELVRAYLVYTTCGFETIVENNMKVSIFFIFSIRN